MATDAIGDPRRAIAAVLVLAVVLGATIAVALVSTIEREIPSEHSV